MSHGQHSQSNHHRKTSRGGRLLSKLGQKGGRTLLWKLRRKFVGVLPVPGKVLRSAGTGIC